MQTDRNAKILPNGMRSLNQPVDKREIEEAELQVQRTAGRVQLCLEELEQTKHQEAKARAHLARVRQAVKRSGMSP